ncbi:MAG: hypothetical protein AAFO86_14180, partial [Pseudomonadota bacterium]
MFFLTSWRKAAKSSFQRRAFHVNVPLVEKKYRYSLRAVQTSISIRCHDHVFDAQSVAAAIFLL